MSDSGPPDQLRRLGADIDKARSRAGPDEPGGSGDVTGGGTALGFGLRVGIELLAALVVGVGLGLLADHFLGSRPWGLLLGFFLGSAAGVMNVFRAVRGMGGGPPAGRAG